MEPSLPRRGFALAELAATLAIVAILAAMLMVAASESRRTARIGGDLANFKQFASATSAYTADNHDLMWTFSWQLAGTSPLQSAINQTWHILNARSGREHWFTAPPSNWFPHFSYSHLPLLDYLDTSVPQRFTVSPADSARLLWQSDPFEGFFQLPWTLRPPGSEDSLKRWPFSSSYSLSAAFFSRDARDPDSAGTTVSQPVAGSHPLVFVGTLPLGGRRLAETMFPAQKVMLHDQHERHFGPSMPYFMHAQARVPMLFADGSAAVKRTRDANRGFSPNDPIAPTFVRLYYTPQAWEPPTLSGLPTDLVTAHYRFTRSGLRGRDFGGPEVPWVD